MTAIQIRRSLHTLSVALVLVSVACGDDDDDDVADIDDAGASGQGGRGGSSGAGSGGRGPVDRCEVPIGPRTTYGQACIVSESVSYDCATDGDAGA